MWAARPSTSRGPAKAARGPADEQGDPVAAVEGRRFAAPHSGVEAPIRKLVDAAFEARAASRAVVRKEDEDRVVGDSESLQPGEELAEVLVEVGNHPFERRVLRLVASPLVRVAVAGRHQKRAVRRVGGDIGEERLAGLGLDEAGGFAKPHIRAVALERRPAVVHEVGVVEVVVAVVVRDLRHAPAAVPDGMLEALVHRPRGIVVAEVPLPEQSGPVAIGGEDLRHRHLAPMDGGASVRRAVRAGSGGISTGHQRRPGRRAERADVKVGEADRLGMQPI